MRKFTYIAVQMAFIIITILIVALYFSPILLMAPRHWHIFFIPMLFVAITGIIYMVNILGFWLRHDGQRIFVSKLTIPYVIFLIFHIGLLFLHIYGVLIGGATIGGLFPLYFSLSFAACAFGGLSIFWTAKETRRESKTPVPLLSCGRTMKMGRS
jgi:hypothetical protein